MVSGIRCSDGYAAEEAADGDGGEDGGDVIWFYSNHVHRVYQSI